MPSWNEQLFLLLNGTHTSPQAVLWLALGLAQYVVPVVGVALLVGWVRATSAHRAVLLRAVVTALVGLAIVQVIAYFWYFPRPFEIGLGVQLMAHVPEASFPSDHATLMFALAFALIADRSLMRWGLVLLCLAIAVSWARVFLGVHFPMDILGGAVVAIATEWMIRRMFDGRLTGITKRVEKVYDQMLRWAHLPMSIFPRP